LIYNSNNYHDGMKIECDICIIGSGAGGSAAASTLSAAGLKVAVVEYGAFLMPKDFTQREEQMFSKLFFQSGGRKTNDFSIRVLHGHGVGGSTLHNINLCKRLPDELYTHWKLNKEILNPLFDATEKDLNVKLIDEESINRNNALFKIGVNKLGLAGGPLSHNRTGCLGSGFCELGCKYNAKENALKVYVPKLIKNNGSIYTNLKAEKFIIKKKNINKLICKITSTADEVKGEVQIRANKFISSAGAIETPLLLKRSNIVDPFDLVGSKLHLHPGVVASGVFKEKVESWDGIPQSYECTEFLSFQNPLKRIWLITGSAHPIGTASLLPGMGKEHQLLMKKYPYLCTITPMLHDYSSGSVSEKIGGGVNINYKLTQEDLVQLTMGINKSVEILFAAGAVEVLIPGRKLIRVRSLSEYKKINFQVKQGEMEIVSVHPMSSVWMGDDVKSSCVDLRGKYHHLDNLFIADTSLFPTSIGVPPQLSAYTFGHFVAENIISS